MTASPNSGVGLAAVMPEAYRRAFSSALGRAVAPLTPAEQVELRALVAKHASAHSESEKELWAWFGDTARRFRDEGHGARGARPKHVAAWLGSGPPPPNDTPSRPGAADHDEMASHPAAEIFPMHSSTQLASLAADIKANGLVDPIVTIAVDDETMVLDGRNRLAACKLAEVEPKFTQYTGTDPLAFVWSKNAERRQMTQSQLAATGEKFATLKQGEHRGNQYSIGNPHACGFPNTGTASQEYAAKLVGVSVRSIQNARTLRNQGAPELVSMVEGGELSLRSAVKVSALPVEEQQRLVAEGAPAIVERANRKEPAPSGPRLVSHNGGLMAETREGVFQSSKLKTEDQVAVAVRELRKVPLSRIAEVWEAMPVEVRRAWAWLAKEGAS